MIGCGRWGKNYVRVLGELDRAARVVEIYDQDPATAEGVRERFPLISVATELDHMLENPNIDAVVIATPATTHAGLAARALRAGKHVMVEKPLATVLDDAVEVHNLALERKRTLMVGHTFRYNDAVKKVREIVAGADFGRPYYLAARRNHLGLIRPDVSVIWDLAPHDLEIFSWIVGAQPRTVSAVGASFLKADRPDVAFATLSYSNGVVGNIQVSWIDSNKIREVVVIGDRRRVVFNDLDALEPVRVFEKGIEVSGDVTSFGEFKLQLRDGDIYSPKVDMREPLRVQCEHFIECIRDNRAPLTDGADGADVVATLEAIDRSMASGGAPAEVRDWREQEPRG